VSNSGDRVVTRNETGQYVVYRDDDALLRQPGTDVRTETFSDGSTRSTLVREDGTSVVTIRDARGRVLRRARVFEDGTQVELFDDLQVAEPVNVVTLVERAPPPVVVSASSVDAALLRAAFLEDLAYDPGRTYSLRQVREIAAVRNLVPGVDLDQVTFASGSAAIPPPSFPPSSRRGCCWSRPSPATRARCSSSRGTRTPRGRWPRTSRCRTGGPRRWRWRSRRTSPSAREPRGPGYGESFLKVSTEAAEQANRRATIRASRRS
jgi:hypothetical protein